MWTYLLRGYSTLILAHPHPPALGRPVPTPTAVDQPVSRGRRAFEKVFVAGPALGFNNTTYPSGMVVAAARNSDNSSPGDWDVWKDEDEEKQ